MFRDVTAKQFAKELARETREDDIFNGAAALGYYLTLAIFPAMIFLMAMIPYLPIQHVDQAIMDLLHQALPASAADMFSGVVRQITHEQRGGLLSFGFLGALWATSTGMYAIMQQLNITYDVDEARSFVRARLTAIGLSLLFAVLVLGGFSLIVLGGQIQDWLGSRFGFSEALLSFFVVFRWVVIVLGLLLAFALIYYLAPNVEQRFAFITPGSIVGVFVLMLASLAFAWYTQSFGNYDATYGSIGAVIVLMLWLYIAGLSILIGSEINALIEHHSAGGKEKGEHAPGEADRNPAARRRVQESDPEGRGRSQAPRKRAKQAGWNGDEQTQPPPAPALRRPFWTQSVGGLLGTMLTLAVVAALTGGRRPAAAASRRNAGLR
jgi:membrane protein